VAAPPFAGSHSDQLAFALDVAGQNRIEADLKSVVFDLEDAEPSPSSHFRDDQLAPTPADRSAGPPCERGWQADLSRAQACRLIEAAVREMPIEIAGAVMRASRLNRAEMNCPCPRTKSAAIPDMIILLDDQIAGQTPKSPVRRVIDLIGPIRRRGGRIGCRGASPR